MPKLAAARAMAAAGVDVLDVGGQSTAPGRPEVPLEEEAARVLPLIAALRADPRFFVPAYLGPAGWLLIGLAARLNNFYWGLMIGPVTLLGLVFAPDGLRDLVRAATARGRRITVTRVTR